MSLPHICTTESLPLCSDRGVKPPPHRIHHHGAATILLHRQDSTCLDVPCSRMTVMCSVSGWRCQIQDNKVADNCLVKVLISTKVGRNPEQSPFTSLLTGHNSTTMALHKWMSEWLEEICLIELRQNVLFRENSGNCLLNPLRELFELSWLDGLLNNHFSGSICEA